MATRLAPLGRGSQRSRGAARRDRWCQILPTLPWSQRRANLRALFETIAPRYGRLNCLLSLGLDGRWRARAAREAVDPGERAIVLDLASGAGELAAAVIRRAPGVIVLRLDLSRFLLHRGDLESLPEAASLPLVAEMERLPVRPGTCAAATMGFALRHLESLEVLLLSCAKILRPGGCIAFVDMDLPTRGLWSHLYGFYFRRCLPRLAGLLGGERGAYEALVKSVETFPGWNALARAAEKAGFVGLRRIVLSGGAASVFVARIPRIFGPAG